MIKRASRFKEGNPVGSVARRKSYFPRIYQGTEITNREKALIVADEISTTTSGIEEKVIEYQTVFIASLNSESYTLKKPVPILIETEDKIFIASHCDLGLYAQADTEWEAVDALKELIIQFYIDLLNEKELSPIPQKMMVYYREVITRK